MTVVLSEWRDRAACRDVDQTVFYPSEGGSPEPAKRFCRACAVVADCLSYALTVESGFTRRHGVWGGMTPRERQEEYDRGRA